MTPHALLPMGGGQLSTGGRLTMAGTKVFKPGLSPDRRMQQAVVKLEPEVIAEPKATAVNRILLRQGSSAA